MEILFFAGGIIGGIAFLVHSHKKGIQNKVLINLDEKKPEPSPNNMNNITTDDNKEFKDLVTDTEESVDQNLMTQFKKRLDTDEKFREEFQTYIREKKEKFFKGLSEKEREEVEKYFLIQARKMKKQMEKKNNIERYIDPSMWKYDLIITAALFVFLYSVIASYFGWITPMQLFINAYEGWHNSNTNGNTGLKTEEL